MSCENGGVYGVVGRGTRLSPIWQCSSFIFALLLLYSAKPAEAASTEPTPPQPERSEMEFEAPVKMPQVDIEERKLVPTIIPNSEVRRPAISPREPPLQLFYPGSAYTAGISTGNATVGVMLDDLGKPIDYLLIAYTQDYFGRALMKKAHDLEYIPLKIKGVSVPSRYQLGYRFVADMPVILNGNQALAAWRINPSEPPFIYRPRPESELDQKLGFIQAALPRLPKSFSAKDPSTLGVIVSFYVDESGKVRLPNVDFTPDGELVRNAIKAVTLWKFQPPTVRGKPVLAYAAREVSFESAK